MSATIFWTGKTEDAETNPEKQPKHNQRRETSHDDHDTTDFAETKNTQWLFPHGRLIQFYNIARIFT